MEALDHELRRAREEPPPEVPLGVRDRVTPVMAKNARIGGVSGQISGVGKELEAAQGRLAQIESEGSSTLLD